MFRSSIRSTEVCEANAETSASTQTLVASEAAAKAVRAGPPRRGASQSASRAANGSIPR